MYDFVLKIWQNKVMPSAWKVTVICPIFKKGDARNCENFRGISLHNGTYKIFAKILLGHLPLAEALLGEYQCSFRPGRSTVDRIFSVNQMIEKSWE